MAILKLISGTNKKYKYNRTDSEIIEILIRYCTRTRGQDRYPAAYVGYLGFPPFATVEELIIEFINTQIIYHKQSGIRARHEIISFKPGETIDRYGRQHIVDIAYRFACWYYEQGFQTIFSIQTDTEFLHVHYVINTVSFMTGKKYHSNQAAVKREKDYLNWVVQSTTGMGKEAVKIVECEECDSVLQDESLLLIQQPMPAIQFAYSGNPQIVY